MVSGASFIEIMDFWAREGRPDGFGSSDFVRIEIFLCSIDLYWFREPVLLKLWIFWAREGSIFDDFVAEKID